MTSQDTNGVPSLDLEEEICKGTTNSGDRCRRRAGPSGFCHLHDPEVIKQREASEREEKERIQAVTEVREAKLREIRRAVAALQMEIDRLEEAKKQHQLLDSVATGLYIEIEKLTKKAPAEEVTELALAHINEVIKDTKELLESDPYIRQLNVFVPAGDNPQLRDALIVLRQVKQGLERFAKSIDTEALRRKLGEAMVLEMAMNHAIEGMDCRLILERLKKDVRSAGYDFSFEQWEIGSSYQDKEFDLERLVSIDVSEYFGLQ